MATTPEDVARAQTHTWVETPGKASEQCAKCLLILPKETLVENIPACPGEAGRIRR